jgi:hypothetical protein
LGAEAFALPSGRGRREANQSTHVRLFEPLRNVAGLQAVDHLFDITFHEAIQAVDRKSDAMIGNTILWKSIRTILLFSSSD